MYNYFDRIIKGTESEDALIIYQHLQQMVGRQFSLMNYYKEVPVIFDATLLGVENGMAEFEVHEYQVKVINIERWTLIRAPEDSLLHDDFVCDAFYINTSRNIVILHKFGFGRIRSGMRRFVRVMLDHPVESELIINNETIPAKIRDISIGGAAMTVSHDVSVPPGFEVVVVIKLPDPNDISINEVSLNGTVVKCLGERLPYHIVVVEFQSGQQSLQQIAYYINQRQVQIIRELKMLHS